MKNMFFTVINHEDILMFSCHFLNIIFAIYINFRNEKLNTATFIGYYIFQRRFLYVVSQPVFENYQHSHSLTISELFVSMICLLTFFNECLLTLLQYHNAKCTEKQRQNSMNFVGNQFCFCPNFLHNPPKYTINLIRCCII